MYKKHLIYCIHTWLAVNPVRVQNYLVKTHLKGGSRKIIRLKKRKKMGTCDRSREGGGFQNLRKNETKQQCDREIRSDLPVADLATTLRCLFERFFFLARTFGSGSQLFLVDL